jgi:putative sterol carrier protein
MFPFEIPVGATVESLFTEVIPAAHARLVPASAGAETFVAVIAVEGDASYTATVRAGGIDVRKGEEKGPAFWMVVDADAVQMFLDDWTGAKRYVPTFTPPGDLRFPSDPRVLKRIAMVSGKVQLALSDFEGERITMTVASGAAAKKTIDTDDPDVVVELSSDVFLRLLRGEIAPETAIVDELVTVKGKKLVAMQFALALAPFFPISR